MDTEEIRRLRQEKADRKAARLRSWAGSAEKKAESIDASIPHDMQFWTQPGMLRTKRKLRDRMDRGTRLEIHAQELREKADRIQNSVRVAGDAERKRQAVREQRDQQISVGSQVEDLCFGVGQVVRINKKTYSIRFGSGSAYARDKSFVKPFPSAVSPE
jgi:hypothetical protein